MDSQIYPQVHGCKKRWHLRNGVQMLVLLMTPFALDASAFTLKTAPTSLSAWQSPDSYEEGIAPTGLSTDVVEVPVEMTGVRVDDDSVGFVSSLGKIVLGQGSEITFDVSTNAMLNCAVTGDPDQFRRQYGTVVKDGAGRLSLRSVLKVPRDGSSTSAQWDYDTKEILVRKGTLEFPSVSSGVTAFYYGDIELSDNTLLVIGGDAGSAVTCANWIGALSGSGTITNETANGNLHTGGSRQTTFSGLIRGSVYHYSAALLNLTNTESDHTDGLRIIGNRDGFAQGIVGLSKIGDAATDVSSAGRTDRIVFGEYGGRMLYLGTGETTSRKFFLYEAEGRAHSGIIDAGAHGGLTLNGEIYPAPYDYVQRLGLDGSNVLACTIAGGLGISQDSGRHGYAHVTKRGTGTWRLANNNDRAGIVGVAVENGTLQIESIAETNVNCSVGTGDIFAEDKFCTLDAIEPVPYQFRLGSAEAEGVLEYVGSVPFLCSTRPAVLGGAACLVNSATNADGVAQDFRYTAGVSALAGVTNSLRLAGESASENVVYGLSDGEGKLGVAKSGLGTWMISAADGYSGDIRVDEGTLRIQGVGGKFSWFKWTIRQTYHEEKGDVSGELQVNEFGLYDANGARVNGGLKLLADWNALTVGSCAYGRTMNSLWVAGPTRNIDSLFDDKRSSDGSLDISEADVQIDPNDERTHIPIVMRVDPTAGEVASYDWAMLWGTDTGAWGCIPRSWKLEGSVDGRTWYVLDDVQEGHKDSSHSWFATGYYFTEGSAATHTGGIEITGSTNVVTLVSNAVRVASGATLEAVGLVSLGSLVADASGGGTIRGFSFEEEGRIDLVNMPSGGGNSVVFALDFQNVSGLDRIANWNVTCDGKPSKKYDLSVRGNKLVASKHGLMVIVR